MLTTPDILFSPVHKTKRSHKWLSSNIQTTIAWEEQASDAACMFPCSRKKKECVCVRACVREREREREREKTWLTCWKRALLHTWKRYATIHLFLGRGSWWNKELLQSMHGKRTPPQIIERGRNAQPFLVVLHQVPLLKWKHTTGTKIQSKHLLFIAISLSLIPLYCVDELTKNEILQ